MTETALLCLFAFVAGFVDSVVGGGGLIQIPALFLFLPAPLSASVATVFGTNKLSSFCGTSVAMIQFARRVPIRWPSIFPAALTAFAFSFFGARTVALINSAFLKPVILILLIAAALFVGWRKDLGSLHAPWMSPSRERIAGLLTGGVIGFYDGFFGPGTGSFLILIFIGVFGFDFLSASASAKVINFSTNVAAVLYFAATDHILYQFALPMGLCNVLGAAAGSRLAILKGNRFVRAFFLVVVTAMILRFGWDVLGQ